MTYKQAKTEMAMINGKNEESELMVVCCTHCEEWQVIPYNHYGKIESCIECGRESIGATNGAEDYEYCECGAEMTYGECPRCDNE